MATHEYPGATPASPDAAALGAATRTPAAASAMRRPQRGAEAMEVLGGESGDLARRARIALEAAGEPVPTEALVTAVFGVPAAVGGLGGPWGGMLERLLTGNATFARGNEGTWGLASWEATAQRLEEIEFAVIDVESTGLAPGRHRLLEVGAVLVRDGALGAHYQRLINPERAIPQFITQFTGISPDRVAKAASAGKVLPKLHHFLGTRPLVGHNVAFDLGFLNYEADRAGMRDAFPVEGIDTIALARRYLTGMRRAKLDAVAAVLHIPISNRHRALPDARLTARIFALLLARAREEGCETLDDLWAAVHGAPTTRTTLPPNRPTGSLYLNPAWRREFPARPGVYLMKDETGEVIYVGKAKCLKDRLASYYNQPLGYTRKMDGLLQSVREIETRVLGSELEALLTESRLIKQLQPRYNVQLRNYELYPFIKVDLNAAYPRFYATKDVSADGAHYFGPFRSGRIVTATIELLERVFPLRTCTRALPPTGKASDPCLRYHLKRCPGPCRGELDAEAMTRYRTAVAEACAFLGGERADLMARIRQEMYAAAARQDFERAAKLRDALRDADQVLLGQRLISGAVEANNVLIVYPSAAEGALEAFLVRHGRVVEQRQVPADEDAIAAEVRALVHIAASLGTPPARVGREEVDAINIIARWIHHHSEDHERAFFRLPPQCEDGTAIEQFVARVLLGVLRTPATDEASDEVADQEMTLPTDEPDRD